MVPKIYQNIPPNFPSKLGPWPPCCSIFRLCWSACFSRSPKVGGLFCKKLLCSVTVTQQSILLWYNLTFCLNNLRWSHTAAFWHDPSRLCKLRNRISFDIFDSCLGKVETRACVTLRSCAKRLGVPAVTTLPGALHSFNPARAWLEACLFRLKK